MANPLIDSSLDKLKVHITSKLATTQSLLDKLDTSTWNTKDLDIFDTVIAEKRQTEKDHHKMASAAGRTGRQVTPADLKLAAADWRYDTETAGYIFVGSGLCALDRSAGKQCHHEICKEARSKEGLSYLEYDTIIHYSYRIASAKSSRMQTALQKQRDIQLAKDREVGEEWKERAIKKFKYLGKDAGETLVAMAQQLDKTLTLPLIAPPERPDTVVEQVGRALTSRRVRHLPAESLRFMEVFDSMLFQTPEHNTPPDRCWRDHSCFFEYFRNIKLAHVEAATQKISHVLGLNATLLYEYRYLFRNFLVELLNLTKILDRDTRSRPGLTVQEVLKKILQKMQKEEETSTKAVDIWPKGYLYYCLRRCLVIDCVIRERMLKVSDAKPVLTGKRLDDALEKARTEPAVKSPFPSLTKANSVYDYQRCQQRALIHHIIDTLTSANQKGNGEGQSQKMELHTRLVQQFKHKILTEGRTRYKAETKRLGAALLDFKKGREYNEVIQAIDEAQKATIGVLEEAKKKEQMEMEQLESNLENIKFQLQRPSFIVEELPGVKRENSVPIILDYATASFKKEKLSTVIKPILSRGASEIFLAFQTVGINDRSFPDASYVDGFSMQILAENLGPHMKTFTREGFGLETFLRDRYSEGWCIAKMMVRLMLVLSQLSAHNSETALWVLRDLDELMVFGTVSLPAPWLPSFRVIARGILHTYGYLMVEAIRVFGRADVDQFVLSCIWILLLHALISATPLDGVKQFTRAWHFVQEVLDVREDVTWAKLVKEIFKEIIEICEVHCADPFECASCAETLQEQVAVAPHCVEPVLKAQDRKDSSSQDASVKEIAYSEEFDASAAVKVLKYIACRLKDTTSTISAQSLTNLTFAFHAAASKIALQDRIDVLDTPDPSSMHLALHNGCNIWELFSSNEKACGFVAGYKLGYRTQLDLDTVLESLVYYAFSYGSRLRAVRKVQKLLVPLIYPGPLFMAFDQRIRELNILFASTICEDKKKSLEAQTYMNRLDYVLATGIGFQDTKCLHVLQQYCSIAFGDDADISQQVSSILNDMSHGAKVSDNDSRFDMIAQIWAGLEVEHLDVIYSDDEADTESDLEDEHDPLILHIPDDVICGESKSNTFSQPAIIRGRGTSDLPDARATPLPGKLRPVSELAEPILSTVNATAHIKRRSAIVIKLPEVVSRGRGPMNNIQSNRSVKNRAPTPFPRLLEPLMISDKTESTPLDSPQNLHRSAEEPKLDISEIPELFVDVSDDGSDLDNFSPFEVPEEGEVPIFRSLLSPNSTLLDQMQALQNQANNIKLLVCKPNHPLRAMVTSEDAEERKRTQAMFDQVYRMETQMRDFQESLGVYDWMLEREGRARFAAAESSNEFDSESTSSVSSIPLNHGSNKNVSVSYGSDDDVTTGTA